MAGVQGQYTLPLLAFQHHVGQLYIDPADLNFGKGLGQSDLCIVEQGRWKGPNGKHTSVVCKVWRPFVVATPQDFRELLLEASWLHRLQHPNVARFLGLGCFAHGSLAEVRESMFMVEEYVGERTLRKLISEQMRFRHKNLYDMRAALRWAGQVASALAALHEQTPPYVHNDVKADNVFLTDAPASLFLSDMARVGMADAKLGDLKPHRHVYDREPSTLSRHHQQQRLQSPRAPHPGTLQQPRYSLERNSGGSSSGGGDGQRRLSSSSSASSTAAALVAVRPPAVQQHQQLQQQGGLGHLVCKTSGGAAGAGQQQQQKQKQPKTPAFLHASPASAFADADGSWSSGESTGTPTAADAAAAAAAAEQGSDDKDSATRLRSLPVPIGARSSHTSRGGSCPSNWNPGLDSQPGPSSGSTDCADSPPAAAAEDEGSPAGYVSASSHCSYRSAFGSASSQANSSSSTACGLAAAPSSSPSSAPPNACSLAAEVAAADAAAAAAATAVAADSGAAAPGDAAADGSRGGGGWRAALRQRSGGLPFLSDSASSTGGTARGSGAGKGGGSLAADADAEDSSADAAAEVMPSAHGHSARDGGTTASAEELATSSPRHHPLRGTRRGGLAKGALATAFAQHSDAQQQQQSLQGAGAAAAAAELSTSPPDVGQAAPSSPQQQQQQRLLGPLYKRSKSSPLEVEGVCQHQPHMQLAHSAPDVTHSDVGEEAVHHGALLMPLQLSEPTGLCSLQSATDRPTAAAAAAAAADGTCSDKHRSKAARARKGPAAGAAGAAAVAALVEQEQGAAGSMQPHLRPTQSQPISSSSGAGRGSCVYYGWELLPSGAASPCGAVHSSMLDLFADVAADDVVTSRRFRDSCHYTLVPGSFVHHKAPPISITPAAAGGLPPGSIARSRSTPAGGSCWDAAAVPAGTTISITSSGSSQVAASAGSKWTSTSLLALQAQHQQQQQAGGGEQLERAPSIGKGYAPTAIESKQHGSNSAFAALTAIDCIAEEGSSIATDSCAPSCSASRDTSAQGGTHFFDSAAGGLSARASSGSLHTPQQQQQQQQHSPLVTSGSLSKALQGLSLLRGAGSGGLRSSSSSSSSGALGEDDAAANSSPASPAAAAGDDGGPVSPSKRHLLQLLVTASGGSFASTTHCSSSGDIPAAAAAQQQQQSPLDENAAFSCASANKQQSVRFQQQPEQQQHEQAICGASAAVADGSPAAAAAAAAAPAASAKKVRFSLARPSNLTASRDFSLVYAAPELVRGERPTEKVDVFAFGVVLYELLARKLVAASVADVCARNASKHGRGSKHHAKKGTTHHSRSQQGGASSSAPQAAQHGGDAAGADGAGGDSDSDELPEPQLLLSYAQLVSGGYRPPMLPHFPEPVCALIRSCWAAEPHERPRMAEVLGELQSWSKNRPLLSALNAYVLALADMGYTGSAAAKQPACGCVIS